MKNKILIYLGITIFIVSMLIDRFLISINDYIYIPALLISSLLIITGIILDKRQNNND